MTNVQPTYLRGPVAQTAFVSSMSHILMYTSYLSHWYERQAWTEIIIDAPIRCDEPRIGHAKKEISKKQRFTQSCQPFENEIIKKLVHVAIVLQFLSKIYCPWGWGSWISPSLSNHKQLKIFRKPSNGYRRNGYQQVTWVISNRWIVFVVSTRTRTPCTIDKYLR